jgi:hypothetical protein
MPALGSFLLRASLPFRKGANHTWLTFCSMDMDGLLLGGALLACSVALWGLAVLGV